MTKAWMLRQDGKAFDVIHHFYVMFDSDLSSEAEVSAFLISTKSKDIKLAKYILDAWMALLIENSISYEDSSEDINNKLSLAIDNLPYRFQYPLTKSELLDIHTSENNYDDIDSYYDFIDLVRSNIGTLQKDLSISLNQQFCRVRFGGQYMTESSNNSLWFRISSIDYNWANTIYIFTTEIHRRLNVASIYICRDYESDYGDAEGMPEFFYKAKDGTPYYNMPIDEYLVEEHEHNPVFSSNFTTGKLKQLSDLLSSGTPYSECIATIYGGDYSDKYRLYSYSVSRIQALNCVCASEIHLALNTRTQMRLRKVLNNILNTYPELSDIDIDEIRDRENSKGNKVSSEIIFRLHSDVPELDNLQLSVILPRGLSDTTPDSIFRFFRLEYNDYKTFKSL